MIINLNWAAYKTQKANIGIGLDNSHDDIQIETQPEIDSKY